MQVLIVEDEAPKCAHIERCLRAIDSALTIRIARSVNSALDAIDEQMPDLILLDMSLPTFDVGERESGGRPQGFGGLEILRHMVLAEIECPTVVITGYDAFPREGSKPLDLAELRNELLNEFPGIVRGVLHFNSTYDEWKIELTTALSLIGIRIRRPE